MKNKITKKQIYIPYTVCKEICSIIQEKFGIVIHPENQDLISKILEKTMEGGDVDYNNFLKNLSTTNINSEMIKKIITLVTIGETYFFRDAKQIDLLRKIVIPAIIDNKKKSNKKTLRIWSAGCSSGEELYTVIMIINEMYKDINEWNFQFLGTDINSENLQKAILGHYKEWSMRSISEDMLKKYFTYNGRSYLIDEKIKKMATFEYLNINTDFYPSLLNGTGDQDLILCRNVLIYFDVDHIEKIMTKLSHCLNASGYLLLGASDPCMLVKEGLLHHPIYPSLFFKSDQELNIQGDSSAIEEYIVINKKEDKKTIKIPEYSDNNTTDIILTEIEKLELSSNWEEIISLLNNYSMTNRLNERMHIIKANAYANLGKTKEAINECKHCLSMNPLNEIAYFVYAIILSEEKQYNEAEKLYKKSLFLNPNFIMCLYQYGLYLIRHEKHTQGIKMLKRALEQSKSFNLDAIVPESGKMNYRDIINLVENEINIHKHKSIEENI